MKKHSLLLLLALAGIMLACDHQNKPQTPALPQDIKDYDMVMLDNGKLYFYNTATATQTLLEAETDSVVNTCFEPDILYYCVAKDNHILLRCIDLTQPNPQPKELADWGVPYEECVTETYGTVSPLEIYRNRETLGLYYNFSWDGNWFNKQKLYDLETGEIADWTWEWEEAGADEYDNEEQTEENYHYISTSDEIREYLTQTGGQFYFADGDSVCLTDKIDFNRYISDPDYATEVEFEYISSSPDNLKILYMIILEWGDFPHGILAISSTDGKFQMPLEDTDCTGFMADWLDDGSLVYVGQEPLSPDDPDADENWHYRPHCIKRIYPDGHTDIIAHCGAYQMKNPILH